MALPNDKRSLQDRLSRVATRMAQKFGNGVFLGVTSGTVGASAGIPVNVLVNRIAGKKIALDNLGRENASALSFTLLDTANGATATQEQLIADTYIPAQMPTGFYGSPAALVMLAKLKAGLDSVDFHIIGDSNTVYSGGTIIPSGDLNNVTGWAGGLHKGLIRGCCAAVYATPIQPTLYATSTQDGGNGSNATPAGGNITNYRVANQSLFNGATSEIWANGATVQSGLLYAPSSVSQYFTSNGIRSILGGQTSDFAWFATKGVSFTRGSENNSATYLYEFSPGRENNSLDTRNALTYRVVHSVLPNPGSFPIHIYGTTTGNWSPSTGVGNGSAVWALGGVTYSWAPANGQSSTNYASNGYKRISVSGATGMTASYLTWAADSNRTGITIGWGWFGNGSAFGGNTWAEGPMAIYMDSLHGNTKGFAINPVQCWSGSTTGRITSAVSSASTPEGTSTPSYLRTFLQETRERQTQAGGSGNVIVFVNSGINDAIAGATGDYSNQIKTIISSYKNTWNSLLYPENDLAFIITTTHPTQAGDSNLEGVRTSGKTIYTSGTETTSNVLYVDITQLGTNGITYGGLTSGSVFSANQNYYQTLGGPAHLATGVSGGYAYLAELLVRQALRYSVSGF